MMKFVVLVAYAILQVAYGCEFKAVNVTDGTNVGKFFTHGMSLDWVPQLGTDGGWPVFGDFTNKVEPYAEIVKDDPGCWWTVRHEPYHSTTASFPSSKEYTARHVFSSVFTPQQDFFRTKDNIMKLEETLGDYYNESIPQGYRFSLDKFAELGFKGTRERSQSCLKLRPEFLQAVSRLPRRYNPTAYANFAARFGWGGPNMLFFGNGSAVVTGRDGSSKSLGSFGSLLETEKECEDPAPLSLRYQDWASLDSYAFTTPFNKRHRSRLDLLGRNIFTTYIHWRQNMNQEAQSYN